MADLHMGLHLPLGEETLQLVLTSFWPGLRMGYLYVRLHLPLGEEALRAGLALPHPELFPMLFTHMKNIGLLVQQQQKLLQILLVIFGG